MFPDRVGDLPRSTQGEHCLNMFVLSTWHRMVVSFGGPKHVNTAADCGIAQICCNSYVSLARLLSLTMNAMLSVFSHVRRH